MTTDSLDLFARFPEPMIEVRLRDGRPVVTATNTAFDETFGVASSTSGLRPERELPADWSERSLVERLSNEAVRSGPVRRRTVDGYRYFRIHALPTDEPRQAYVRYDDVTEEHRRKRQVTVLARLLRHDLRNNLNVVLGYAQALADVEEQPEVRAKGDAIATVAENLVRLGEAAGQLRALERPGHVIDLRRPVDQFCATIETRLDGTTVDRDVSNRPVFVDDRIQIALDELCEHIADLEATPSDVDVRLVAGDRMGQLTVTLDRAVISTQECRALNGHDETPLRHPSGLRFWLVRWAITNVGGTIDVTVRERSCRLTFAVPLADEPPSADNGGQVEAGD